MTELHPVSRQAALILNEKGVGAELSDDQLRELLHYPDPEQFSLEIMKTRNCLLHDYGLWLTRLYKEKSWRVSTDSDKVLEHRARNKKAEQAVKLGAAIACTVEVTNLSDVERRELELEYRRSAYLLSSHKEARKRAKLPKVERLQLSRPK